MRLADTQNLQDVARLARRRLPRAVSDYVDGGAEDEVTVDRNRQRLRDLALVPRALVDVSRRDQSTVLLGTPVSAPVVLAPVGLAALAHPDGERAAARAASRLGIVSTLSSSSCWSLEAVAGSCGGPKWFQVYVLRDRELTAQMVERARAAGYRALCLTVDVPVGARRERDLHNGFSIPPRPTVRHALDVVRHTGWFVRLLRDELAGHGLTMGNFATVDASAPGQRLVMMDMVNRLFDPSVTPADVAWLKQLWRGPLVVKGVMTPDDARRCVDAGADAVWVSNHGGRQQDALQATVDALPAVVDEVATDAEVYVDGGFRRGSDVVKALALGARAVMIGRPYVHGLAAGGQEGVETVLRHLLREVDTTLALLGRPTLADLDRTAVTPASRTGAAAPTA